MAKGVKTVKIDDAEFELTQLGGVEGGDMFDRLTKELGPVVMNAIRSGLLKSDVEAGAALAILDGFSSLPSDLKRELRVLFAGLSKVKKGDMFLALGDGRTLETGGIFDQHFAGRFGHMVKWLLAAMKWSFGDFLPRSADSDAAKATPTP